MSDILTEILGSKSKVGFKIGLYFGSFNPIHIGHMAIANYLVEYTDIDQLWFVVSPQNPFKKQENLLDDFQRFEMVHRAIGDDKRFRASNIEFKLSKPSYTIDTLTYLKEQFPNHRFSIVMGADNFQNFGKWKNSEVILENYGILVYPRPGIDMQNLITHRNISTVHAPLMEISSTFIRESIKNGKDIRHYMPHKAWEYLDEMNFYKS
jgi:nicotinate-nucleotide adenylyltransferase